MFVNTPRVLHIVKSLGLGGTEKVMQLMVTNLNKNLYVPIVYSSKEGERAELLRKHNIPLIIGGDIFSHITRIQPAIIHIHRAGWPEPEFMRPILKSIHLLNSKGARPILVETNVFGRRDPSSEKNFNSTLFVSHFCARRFATIHGIPTVASRYFVLYNPIDYSTIEKFTLTPSQRNYSQPVAGRISRADPGKWSKLGVSFLPAVCTARPDFSYLIIGGIQSAKDYVSQHNLNNNVKFLPNFVKDTDLAAFLNKISIFVHANDTGESFGLVIAEAMAAGLPVITHPCPGLRDNAQLELVEHNKTGLVLNNTEEYAQAILWLLAHPEQARSMGENGRKKAARLYRSEIIAKQLENIYNILLTEGKNANNS